MENNDGRPIDNREHKPPWCIAGPNLHPATIFFITDDLDTFGAVGGLFLCQEHATFVDEVLFGLEALFQTTGVTDE